MSNHVPLLSQILGTNVHGCCCFLVTFVVGIRIGLLQKRRAIGRRIKRRKARQAKQGQDSRTSACSSSFDKQACSMFFSTRKRTEDAVVDKRKIYWSQPIVSVLSGLLCHLRAHLHKQRLMKTVRKPSELHLSKTETIELIMRNLSRNNTCRRKIGLKTQSCINAVVHTSECFE